MRNTKSWPQCSWKFITNLSSFICSKCVYIVNSNCRIKHFTISVAKFGVIIKPKHNNIVRFKWDTQWLSIDHTIIISIRNTISRSQWIPISKFKCGIKQWTRWSDYIGTIKGATIITQLGCFICTKCVSIVNSKRKTKQFTLIITKFDTFIIAISRSKWAS